MFCIIKDNVDQCLASYNIQIIDEYAIIYAPSNYLASNIETNLVGRQWFKKILNDVLKLYLITAGKPIITALVRLFRKDVL